MQVLLPKDLGSLMMPHFLTVSLGEFLEKPVAVPNEVDNLVFRGQLKGKFTTKCIKSISKVNTIHCF